MHYDRLSRTTWLALSQEGLGAAALHVTLHHPHGYPAHLMPLWACLVAATPADGEGSLDWMARRLPHYEEAPPPGLQTVYRLHHAVQDGDSYTATQAVAKIRHYAPATSRQMLMQVLVSLQHVDSYEPGSQDIDGLFADLRDLMEIAPRTSRGSKQP